SFDPDGTLASRAWSFGDGTVASGAVVRHAYATPGTYTATLTVTDDGGLSASASMVVTAVNRPPRADCGPAQETPAGASVLLDGSRSTDPDGTIRSYVWTFGDGASATGAMVTHVYAAPGAYTPTLTVSDDLGATGTASSRVDVMPQGGEFRWATRAGGTGGDLGQGVAIDGSGNVLVAGYFTGTADFGGGPATAIGSYDLFVAKYTGSGAYFWARHFGGTGLVVGQSVAVDANGDVAVTGYFTGTVDFGGGPLTSAGSYDIFVMKLSGADGSPLWAKRFGSPNDDIGYGVAVDAGGNVLVTGYFRDAADFGGGPLTSTYGGITLFGAKFSAGGALLTSAGRHDGFVAKLSRPDGAHLWAKRFGSTNVDYGYAVAVDAGGNVAVTGFFQGTVDFGGGPLVSAGLEDIFVEKLAGPDGAHLWSKRFGGTSTDYGYGVAIDGAGNVLSTGYFQNSADFGGGPLTSAGRQDAFVLSLGP